MSDRKFTDDEVIKTLECCKNADCLNCPRWSEEWTSGMCNDFLQSVLDLINRQKAEIVRLEEEKEQLKADFEMFTDIGKMYSEVKADAIKEFANELKAQFEHLMYVTGDEVKSRIDNLVKEMVGED